MSNHIKAIDRNSVHRICSGQVVLNLAIAVKELVENSLDAGSTKIDVKLKDYGSEIVEVTDNGSGVHPDNFQALTLKHHTSKLSEFSDLESIATFGFRGEALSSLCALSKVTVLTRHSSQEAATSITFDHNGVVETTSKISRQVGTTVSLVNLFSTLPVRLKEFHRNLKKEFNKMTQLLYSYCLVSTGVKITCTNQTNKGTKTTFVSTQGCSSVKENIACIFGPKQLSGLLAMKEKKVSEDVLMELKISEGMADMFKFEGYVSSCAHGSGRSANDRQFFYINSRPCEPSKVIRAVNEVYHQFNLHQYPFVFLNIFVERTSVDVNVTPDKRQIFLDQEKLLVAAVKASLLDLYEKIPSTYSVNSVKPASRCGDNESKPKLNLLSQWRHRSDHKRESTSPLQPDKKPKQMRLDKGFFKTTAVSSPNQVSTTMKPVFASIHSAETLEYSEEENGNTVSVLEQFENAVKPFMPQRSPHLEKSELAESSSQISDNSSSEQNVDELEVTKQILSIRNNIPRELENEKDEYLKENTEIVSPINENQTSELPKQCENCPSEEKYERISNEGSVETDSQVPVTADRRIVYSGVTIDSLKQLMRSNKDPSNQSEDIQIKFRTVIDPSKNVQAEEELSKEISKDMFSKMKIIGQFNLGFIITKLGSDLFIVDQHATDEKYNFETLQRTTTLSNQILVVPQSLDLTAANECILLENIDIFKKNGFEFKIDETAPTSKKIRLMSIPMSRNWVFGKEDIDELLFMLQDSPGSLCRPSRVRAMFASRACRRSVMIGTPLSITDMRRLIDHMGEIEQPWNCPHGRPTMRHLVNLSLINAD